jgi:TonB family protein
MKNFIIASATFLFIGLTTSAQDSAYNKKWYANEYIPNPGLRQNLNYEVRGRYTLPVKKEKLNEAKLLSDFIPGYPVNWISNYTSVEILANSDGNKMKSVGSNDILNTEQKNILRTADLGTEIIINVKDKYKNPVTDIIYDRDINVSMMVIPEIEAEFIGGNKKLSKYFNEKVINVLYEKTPVQFQKGIVNFTVNEKGEIENAKISVSSGDPATDKFLLDSINKMPKWKPAENFKGTKVKQDFVFSLGSGGC